MSNPDSDPTTGAELGALLGPEAIGSRKKK